MKMNRFAQYMIMLMFLYNSSSVVAQINPSSISRQNAKYETGALADSTGSSSQKSENKNESEGEKESEKENYNLFDISMSSKIANANLPVLGTDITVWNKYNLLKRLPEKYLGIFGNHSIDLKNQISNLRGHMEINQPFQFLQLIGYTFDGAQSLAGLDGVDFEKLYKEFANHADTKLFIERTRLQDIKAGASVEVHDLADILRPINASYNQLLSHESTNEIFDDGMFKTTFRQRDRNTSTEFQAGAGLAWLYFTYRTASHDDSTNVSQESTDGINYFSTNSSAVIKDKTKEIKAHLGEKPLSLSMLVQFNSSQGSTVEDETVGNSYSLSQRNYILGIKFNQSSSIDGNMSQYFGDLNLYFNFPEKFDEKVLGLDQRNTTMTLTEELKIPFVNKNLNIDEKISVIGIIRAGINKTPSYGFVVTTPDFFDYVNEGIEEREEDAGRFVKKVYNNSRNKNLLRILNPEFSDKSIAFAYEVDKNYNALYALATINTGHGNIVSAGYNLFTGKEENGDIKKEAISVSVHPFRLLSSIFKDLNFFDKLPNPYFMYVHSNYSADDKSVKTIVPFNPGFGTTGGAYFVGINYNFGK